MHFAHPSLSLPLCSLLPSQFLPNVGRLVADCLEGVLDPATAAKFAVDRGIAGAINGERASVVPRELDLEELWGPGEELGV